MFSRSIAYLVCISVLSWPLAISAQDTEPTPRDEIIMNAWSAPSNCKFDNAKAVSFSDLVNDAQKLLGECVAVEGYWRGRALFNSAKHAKMRRSNTSKRLRGKRLGLYAQWEQVVEPPDKPTRIMFVGRVGHCETQWPDAIMVLGYCHYTGGPILLASQAHSV